MAKAMNGKKTKVSMMKLLINDMISFIIVVDLNSSFKDLLFLLL